MAYAVAPRPKRERQLSRTNLLDPVSDLIIGSMLMISVSRIYQLLLGDDIPQGPFREMRYIRACIGSALWPKLLGTYEMELNDAVEDLIRWDPDGVINAGAAEGYYAVGLARRLPDAAILAYEMSDLGRKLLGLLSRKNGVGDRMTLHGELTCNALQQALASMKRPGIVLDVEGAEVELLDFDRCPDLRRAFVLLETHDTDIAGSTTLPEMLRRFSSTHSITEIPIKPRTLADLPSRVRWLTSFGMKDRLLDCMDEGRGVAPPWLRLAPLQR